MKKEMGLLLLMITLERLMILEFQSGSTVTAIFKQTINTKAMHGKR
jgi:hypothetical protein